MIDTKELMIGSYIESRGNIWKVSIIAPDFVECYEDEDLINFSDDLERFDPIPITPEILLKMGFTWVDEKHGWMELGYEDYIDHNADDASRYIAFYTKPSRLVIETEKADHGEISFTDCKYVHDLQRYVYACCDGFELTIGGEA